MGSLKKIHQKCKSLKYSYLYLHTHTHVFIYAKIYVRKVPRTFLNVCPIIITSLREFPSTKNGHGH